MSGTSLPPFLSVYAWSRLQGARIAIGRIVDATPQNDAIDSLERAALREVDGLQKLVSEYHATLASLVQTQQHTQECPCGGHWRAAAALLNGEVGRP